MSDTTKKKCPKCGGLPGVYPNNVCPTCYVKEQHNTPSTPQPSDTVEDSVLIIDPSALDFYFEAVLPDIPPLFRVHMRKAIMRGIDAYTQQKVIDELESLIKGQYVSDFTKHIQARANELKDLQQQLREETK